MNRYLLLICFLILAQTLEAQNHRYINITSFGILAGTSADEHEAPLSFISEHHYRIVKLFSAGLMTGIEQLKENTMPVALNLKLYLPSGKSSFFFSGYGGYNVSLEKPPDEGIKKAKGGIMTGLETGFFIGINDFASVYVAIGYRYNELDYKLNDWWIGNYQRHYTFNRFSARIGIALY